MKTCSRCKKEKSFEEFRPSSHNNDGLGSWCASCHAEAARCWREENPDKVKAYNARRRAEYVEARQAKRDALRQGNVERLREWTAAEQVRRRKNERARTTRKVA